MGSQAILDNLSSKCADPAFCPIWGLEVQAAFARRELIAHPVPWHSVVWEQTGGLARNFDGFNWAYTSNSSTAIKLPFLAQMQAYRARDKGAFACNMSADSGTAANKL